MTIHWSLLVPGALLLLFPTDRLLSSVVELRSFDCFQCLENSPRHRPWWWVPALWLDPLRGFFGALLVRDALVLSPSPWVTPPTAEYILMLALLGTGVVIQTFTRREAAVLLAPLGYVAGVALLLAPWTVACTSVASGALGLFAFRQFPAFFAFGFAAIGLIGFALGAGVAWIAPAAGAFALPLLAGVLTGSTLELPTRSASGPAEPRLSL